MSGKVQSQRAAQSHNVLTMQYGGYAVAEQPNVLVYSSNHRSWFVCAVKAKCAGQQVSVLHIGHKLFLSSQTSTH